MFVGVCTALMQGNHPSPVLSQKEWFNCWMAEGFPWEESYRLTSVLMFNQPKFDLSAVVQNRRRG